MPHVDDGILHAWLDGAIDALEAAGELPAEMTKADVISHLSTCPDCRARLEAEREVRERAGLVLHDASLPIVEVPAFDALATESRSRRGPRRMLPLSWAASVLLAVGAGWWGSAQWRTGMPDAVAAREEAAMPPAAFEAGPASNPESAPDAQSAAADGASAAPPAAYLPEAEAGRGVAARRDPSESMPDPANASRRAADSPPAPVVASSRGQTLAAPPPAEARADEARTAETSSRPVPAAPPPVADAQAERALAAADTTILGEAIRPTRTAVDVTSAASAARREMQRPQSLASGALRLSDSTSATVYLVPNAEMRAFEGLLLRARTGQLRWSAVTPGQSAGVADQLFVIEGASEPRIERASDGESTSVRITQRLESGMPVELVVWRQEAVVMSEVVVTAASADSQRERTPASRGRQAQSAAAPEAAMNKATTGATAAPLVTTGALQILPDGRRELVLRSSATPVWIALRADLSDAQLRDLARRIVVLDERR